MSSGPTRRQRSVRLHGLRSMRRLVHRLRSSFAPSPLILMYHRVVSLPTDPNLLAVTPRHFAEHLALLRDRYRVVPLRRLAEAVGDWWAVRSMVAITLDDGYADNLHHAKPLLEQHGLPATVFVSTGQLGSRSEPWWDELERLLLQPGRLPSVLRLKVDGHSYESELGSAVTYVEEAFERHRGWHVEQPNDPTPRQRLFRSLYHQLHATQPRERERLLQELRAWAGTEREGRPSHRMLTAEELVELDRAELIEIGAHTVSHPVLANLPALEQQQEIQESKHQLEQVLRHPVTSFAYPHGAGTPETITLVRDAGFERACCSDPGLVPRRSNRYWLPRVEIRDCDGEQFARSLRAWLRP